MKPMPPLVRGAACAALALALTLPSGAGEAARLKDIARVEGVRANQLVGYGLVVGLDGTGDTRRVAFTLQSMTAMLSRVGVRADPSSLVLRNVAAVMVTAKLPPFVEHGTPIDASVSSIGDARSLEGGTLILTPLLGVDGQTYAMAQGAIQVGGYSAGGLSGSRVVKNHLNVGRIPGGGLVERAVPVELAEGGELRLVIDRPDFSTAQAVADAVTRSRAAPRAGSGRGRAAPAAEPAADAPSPARVLSSGVVSLTIRESERGDLPSLIARLEQLQVTPDAVARVVLNGRTGTIVIGENVRISPVAVAHGGLRVEVEEQPQVSQPGPLARGTTAVTPTSTVRATEASSALKQIKSGATLAAVVSALKALGAKPRDLVEILQAIDASGALQGELEVL